MASQTGCACRAYANIAACGEGEWGSVGAAPVAGVAPPAIVEAAPER